MRRCVAHRLQVRQKYDEQMHHINGPVGMRAPVLADALNNSLNKKAVAA